MQDWQAFSLSTHSTIKEALKAIDAGAIRFAVVLDDAQRTLVGVLTDGDLRRGLLKGLDLNDSIASIINRHPITCRETDSLESVHTLAAAHQLQQIPIVDACGTLQSVEVITPLPLPNSPRHANTVVLMAGGLGQRLRPLTDTVPKPMLKVGNRPILETIILDFKRHGFHNIILSVNYLSDVIESYFGNGEAFGVSISYVYETERKGTAGSLSLMRDRLQGDFFVMNGDLLTKTHFEHFLHYHQQQGGLATMGVRRHTVEVPYGVLDLAGNRIAGIEEKPRLNFFVNAGMYLLNERALDYVPEGCYFDMPTLFNKLVAAGEASVSFPIHEYWLDIGRPDEFQQANEDYERFFS